MQRRSEWREEEGGVEVEESIISASDQRTLYLVNIFIVQTARFLNRFSFLCEDKLSTFHRRISRLDASLTLLETQLRSIIEDEEGKESSASMYAFIHLFMPYTTHIGNQVTFRAFIGLAPEQNSPQWVGISQLQNEGAGITAEVIGVKTTNLMEEFVSNKEAIVVMESISQHPNSPNDVEPSRPNVGGTEIVIEEQQSDKFDDQVDEEDIEEPHSVEGTQEISEKKKMTKKNVVN
ncbi:hypothetical protein C5167_006829 [Papaver somniferum]|uniref:Uncharacterized protein n=1 Tax=Papaver somniferum TaxID=3469 RepID=A0A4Y7JG72_PAPSO|nr:hypothetical protein C5167_006829 [Papaver somniferum]